MTLTIEAGKYYMTRDGRKVGPMVAIGVEDWPWQCKTSSVYGAPCWTSKGLIGWRPNNKMDLIAEWAEEPALPHGHARLPSGKVVDLTAITTPFGLLDAETREALSDHGGPYELFSVDGVWLPSVRAAWYAGNVCRVKPQPPAPVVGEVVAEWNTAYGFAGNDGPDDCKTTHRLTLSTHNGHLVPGAYIGPNGLVVKVEAL